MRSPPTLRGSPYILGICLLSTQIACQHFDSPEAWAPERIGRFLIERLPELPAAVISNVRREGVSGGVLQSICIDRDHSALKELGLMRAVDRHKIIALWSHFHKGCSLTKPPATSCVSWSPTTPLLYGQEAVATVQEAPLEKTQSKESQQASSAHKAEVTGQEASPADNTDSKDQQEEQLSMVDGALGSLEDDGPASARRDQPIIAEQEKMPQGNQNLEENASQSARNDDAEEGEDKEEKEEKEEEMKVQSDATVMSEAEAGQAEAKYTALINNDPDNRLVHMGNYGNFLFRQKRKAEAIEAYRGAMEEGATDSGHLGNYAVLLEEQHKYEEAEKVFRRALVPRPDHGINLGNFANLMLRQKRYEEAEPLYKRALEADFEHESSKAEHQAEYAAMLKTRGNTADALQHYSQALQANPGVHVVHLDNYAVLLGKEGRIDEAQDMYKRAILLKPTHPSTYYNMACLRSMQNNTDDALQWLRKAAKLGYSDEQHAKADKDLIKLKKARSVEFQSILGSMKLNHAKIKSKRIDSKSAMQETKGS